MDRRSWIALLEVLEGDAKLRSKLEAAAKRGPEQLVSAFQALGPRVKEAPSRADVAALLGASARRSREITDEELERVSGGTGDDGQLANVDLQNMLQKQQQTLQTMSNISKMLSETGMAVIRKIGG